MASSGKSDLAANLENLGKMLRGCEEIQKIESEIIKATENLRSLNTDADKINVSLHSLENFLDTLSETIKSSESLSVHMKNINKSRSEFLTAFKGMAQTLELKESHVKMIKNSLESLLAEFHKFGIKLGNFEKNLRELQRISDRVSGEALREQEKVKKEAASTRSDAQLESVAQWTKRILTLGLITRSSSFQQDVANNEERYINADKLDNLSVKFRQAHMLLDVAAKTVGGIINRMEGGAIKLTEDLITIITKLLVEYERMESFEQKIQEKDCKITDLNAEIAHLRRKLEEANRKN